MALFPLKNTISLALIIATICSFPTSLLAQSVSDIVSESFFNGIIDKADSSCEGKGFYTRDAFLGALSSFSEFGTSGSSDDNKKEIAAFFAHVSHETTNMCHIKENGWDGSDKEYCDTSTPEAAKYPCTAGKKYYGRGPLQLTWNYNYGGAGQALNFDGLNNPEIVATDVDKSFKASMWFWMTNVHSVVNNGFGATIKVINGAEECNGNNRDKAESRVQFYKDYCSAFGVDPESDNLYC